MDRDPALRSTSALLSRIDKLSTELLKRYIAIIDLANPPEIQRTREEEEADPNKDDPQPLDRNMTAVNTFRIEVESAALIRTAQSITSLTRSMKEMWLFGQLDTLGKSEALEQTEKDALAVTALVEGLLKRQNAKSSANAGTEKSERMEVES